MMYIRIAGAEEIFDIHLHSEELDAPGNQTNSSTRSTTAEYLEQDSTSITTDPRD